MYSSILVSLDGSSFAEAALPWALSFSRRADADLHLATVHEPVPSFSYDEWESAAWEWSEEYLAKVRDRVTPLAGGTVDAWVGSGRVVDCLLRRAEDVKADLVVMATHGRGAFTRAWLGSVTDGLLRHTNLPVLVVRPPEKSHPDLEEERPEPRCIVVPLDGSKLAESELDHARKLAELFGSCLNLVRVVAYPVEIASPYLPHTVQMNQHLVDEAKEAAEDYLASRAEPLREAGLEVHTHVLVDAQPGHAIAEVAESTEADLVIMSTHGRKGIQRALLGSTTDKVIRSVKVPVLVRRPE
jgi:nucleotide-binding universal stress UspA family protein